REPAIYAPALLASYNADLVVLEQVKGTLLDRYGIEMAFDPCRQLKTISPALTRQQAQDSALPRQSGPPPDAMESLPSFGPDGSPPALAPATGTGNSQPG